MEGRALAKSGWHVGPRRLYRKIGSNSGQAKACFRGQFQERETTEGGRGGEQAVDKENLPFVGVRTLREESTEVVDEQRLKGEEQLRGPATEREEWKRKGEGRLPEGIIVNDDEEDGVHGGRMKPLASFDVNRDMPPPQTRKLRIKLSSPDANQTPTTDGAPPKAARRSQDKENRGLVPLCPGTTQIKGMKRKTGSPADLKAPGGGKRNRPPLGSGGNATEQLKKGPAENSAPRSAPEFERADSRGMDILLMALKAADEKAPEAEDRNVPPAKPTVIQATNGEKALKNPRPRMKVVGATAAHLHPRQDKVDARKQDDGDSRSSDEDEDEDEESDFFDYNVMRPHRIKIGDGPSVPAPWTLTPRALEMFKEEDSSGSDEDLDCTEVLTYPVRRPHRIKIGNGPSVPAPWTLEKSRKEESSGSDEDQDCAEVLAYPVRRPHRIKIGSGPSVPAAWTLEKSHKEESSDSGEDPDCAKDSSRKHNMKPKSSCRASEKALDNCKIRPEASKEEEDSATTDDKDVERHLEPWFRELYGKLGIHYPDKPRGCRPQPAKSVDGEKRDCKAKDNKALDGGRNGALLERRQYQSAAPTGAEEKGEMQQDFEGRNMEDAAPSCSDDVVEYPRTMKPHGYRPAPPKEAFSKSANLLDGRKENRGGKGYHGGDKNDTVIRPQLCKLPPSQVRGQLRTQARKDGIGATSCHGDEEDDEPIVVKSQHNKPFLTKVVLSEEQNFGKRPLKDCRSTGPSSSIAVESHHHQQHRKVNERRETPGDDSAVGISQLGEDRNRERNDFQKVPKHFTGAKYPPGSRQQQSAWRESSGGARRASDQQPGNYTKKRKSSDHISACFIVPKQVKLATASCLVETGEPAHPSVGSVVVECLPSPTELQKEDKNRAPFCEIQNRDAVRSDNPLQLPHPKLAKTVGGVCDTDKENRSWSSKGTTAADCPSSEGIKAPTCRQVYDGGAGPTQVVKVADKSNILGGSLSAVCPQPLQNSRIDSGSDSQFVDVTHPQQRQQQRSNVTLGAGPIARTRGDNEESETRHEIAGITVQRRSWEALKSAEFFAKRRFDSKPAEPADENNNHNVPSIPSRFQEIHQVDQGKPPEANSGTSHNTHGGAAALSGVSSGVISHNEVLGQKKVTYRRGPYKQGGDKHERLRTKVLNRNLENFAQLKDVRCSDGAVDFSRPHPVQNGAHQFPANGCYGPRSYSVFSKAPTALKTRQRRGLKKLEKEKLKAINVKKISSNVCKFKALSEPSGLLGGLNPGIIQKVRNSVQIHAILGALIRAASCNSSLPKAEPQDSPCPPPAMTKEPDGELKEKPVDLEPLTTEEDLIRAPTTSDRVQETLHNEKKSIQVEASVKIEETLQTQGWVLAVGGNKEEEQVPQVQGSDLRKETLDHEGDQLSNAEQSEPLAMPSQLHHCLPEKAGLTSLKDGDVNADRLHEQSDSPLTQGLSSIVSDDPEHAEEDSNEQELQPMSGTDSSPTAAGLAGRWLDLLTLDIKGRLCALKQSRRRVQSTLSSGQLNPESASAPINPPSTTRSAIDGIDVLGSQHSVTSDATAAPQTNTQDESSSRQVDRWRALFANMDGVLGTEATKLESWLWQIKQMQSFCPGSIPQPFSAPGEKSDVAASCQGGLAPSNVEFEKQKQDERWPLSFEAMEKELRIRRIGCFDNVQS